MKRRYLLLLVIGGIGLWAGMKVGSVSGPVRTYIEAGLVVLIVANLLFAGFTSWRAERGSVDASALADVLPLSAVLFLSIVPRLFWPSNSGIRTAASIASLAILAYIVTISLRRRRARREQAKPA